MQTHSGYRLVRLGNGSYSVHSLGEGETFHPGIGPVAEAEVLNVRQLRIPERVREAGGEFVIWDVGLGAAANALTVIRNLGEQPANSTSALVRIVSFDRTTDALAFAYESRRELGYFGGLEDPVTGLIQNRRADFRVGSLRVEWTLVMGDFPTLMADLDSRKDRQLPAPHAILFDPHSPAKNPLMWTVSLFSGLFARLDRTRPCALATFSRSTIARTALLLGGFFVGAGYPSGLKEETTIAANRIELLGAPLDRHWLERARRSHSAEPLETGGFVRRPLTPETWRCLQEHPQFAAHRPGGG